jgi:hypothetical protein
MIGFWNFSDGVVFLVIDLLLKNASWLVAAIGGCVQLKPSTCDHGNLPIAAKNEGEWVRIATLC